MHTATRHDAAPLIRDRETYRYLDLSYIHGYLDATAGPIPPARPSRDSALTAFAQLALYRIGARRAFVSLLDHRMQYVIAETTATAGFRHPRSVRGTNDEGLIMCGLAFPYAEGISGHVLKVVSDGLTANPPTAESEWRPPVVVIPDVQADSRFAASRLVSSIDDIRFYAAVPIRSPAGPFIGVLSLTDDKPRPDLSTAETDFLADMSLTVMDHLTMIRHKQEEARGKRMMRGLGSFVEGFATMSSLASDKWQGQRADETDKEGMLNVAQQAKMHSLNSTIDPLDKSGQASAGADQMPIFSGPQDSQSVGPVELIAGSTSSLPGHDKSTGNGPDPEELGADPPPAITSGREAVDQLDQYAQDIFSRAANIIRESIEVEGVLFFDASIATAGTTVEDKEDRESLSGGQAQSTHASSSGEESMRSISSESDAGSDKMKMCNILGFSTTETASIDGHRPDGVHLTVPERFLRLLLRRYPHGKIFNFDENGRSLSDTESDSDHDAERANGSVARDTRSSQQRYLNRRAFTRDREPSFIIKVFPHARSVLAFPLWDSHRLRWYAGGVAWTRTPTRAFGVKSELSYLRAFGATIMSEIAKIDVRKADQAKADVLGSISHELRSPLHGILGGIELLQETDMDVFQDSTIHTIEGCGMTLLDTIDHLLDYAKVNNNLRGYSTAGRTQSSQHRRLRSRQANSGTRALASDVNIDAVVEDVVNSIFAGHEFQVTSQKHANADAAGREHEHAPLIPDALTRAQVRLVLDIRPAASWRFVTEIGALRRVVMNIFGNALKYTESGYIHVTLDQRQRRLNSTQLTNVIFTVEDTGRGIGKEFLAHHLFTPFMQEDPSLPGTGLGLSITHRIVKSLGGTITAQSQLGKGTKISVSLPLPHCSATVASDRQDSFEATVGRLRGLRVGLHGFDDSATLAPPQYANLGGQWQLPRVAFDNQCQDWLGMKVLPSTGTSAQPDVYIATLAGAENLAKLNKAGDVIQPVVVLCPSAGSARQLSVTSRTVDRNGVFEYITQPCGPRKLAKAFILALDRWAGVQIQQASEILDQMPKPSPPSPPGGKSESPHVNDDTLDDLDMFTPPSSSPNNSPGSAVESSSPSKEGLNTTQICIDKLPTPPQQTPIMPRRPRFLRLPTPETQLCMPYLVVDDNAINVMLLTTYLHRQNLPIMSATDGALGVAAYKKYRGAFSCVFMDVQMPNLDGISATRAIREYERQEGLRPVYIVMLTGLAMTDILKEAKACGVNNFFPKPVRLKELNPIIAKAMRAVGPTV